MSYNYDKLWKDTYGDIQRVGPTHKHLRRIYLRILKEVEYKSVVDVGCGSGANFPILCKGKEIDRLAGIDISSDCIESIKEKLHGEFRALDIQDSCLENKYDLVFCSLVLEHVIDDDKAIKNLYNMTRKYLLVTSIQGNFKKHEKWEKSQGHVRNYKQGELEKKLIKNGFEIKRKIEWGFPFYSPIVRFLQNINPNVGVGKYDFKTRVITHILYLLYFLNSFHKGDVLIVLAEV